MPYKVEKVVGGYKVKKKQAGKPKYFSKKPLKKTTAEKQMKAIIINEKKK